MCEKKFETGGAAGRAEKVCCSYTCRGIYRRKDIDKFPGTRLGSTMWRRRRLEILDRDGRTCVFCGKTEVNTVHHLVPREKGGGHEAENLGSVCHPCHNAVDKVICIMVAKSPGFDIRGWLNSFM